MTVSFSRGRWMLACALLFQATLAGAQQVPDAGTILRQQPAPPQTAPAKPPVLKPAAPAPAPADSGPRILVKGFRIRGATLIPEAELTAQLRDSIGQQLSLQQLRTRALVLVGYYAQKGYLARVILPPQDVKDGIVEFQVIEGKRGDIGVERKGERIDAERVRRFVEERLPRGAPMNLADLGEALNILNEQPGVSVTSSLTPGKAESEIDIALAATERPLLAYSLGANNSGSRGSGEYQATGSAVLNNPSGNFDALSALVNSSEGSDYGRLDYGVAVGDRGLRLSTNISKLHYRLVQSNFAALQASGTADTAGLALSYPLARRNELNLSLAGSLDHKRLMDRSVVGETGNRSVDVAGLGLSGYTLVDAAWMQGVVPFGANLNWGKMNQHNAGALAADQAGRRVEGGYTKLAYNTGLIRSLSAKWRFNATLRGQLASKNLDSSERLSLGGPDAIRAYPVGEALGDEGWISSFNFDYQASDPLTLSVFVDLGQVYINHRAFDGWNAGNPNLPNRYELAGAGVGSSWRFAPQALLSLSLAAPIGNNPAADASGNDSDNRHRAVRGWLSLSAQF